MEDEDAAFICPLTTKLMKGPMLAPDGYSYEKEAIMEWLADN